MANVFKALSDPTRREILKLLQKSDLNAGQITEKFDMKSPSITHHLHILRDAGLVQSVKKGQQVIYSLNTTVLQEVLNWVLDLQGKTE
jgi:ArsR family transcriptional regulator, arsenate/arsenite/antimonite-responsive transcriptional repressor